MCASGYPPSSSATKSPGRMHKATTRPTPVTTPSREGGDSEVIAHVKIATHAARSTNPNEKFEANDNPSASDANAHDTSSENRPQIGIATAISKKAFARLYPRAATMKSRMNGLKTRQTKTNGPATLRHKK